MCDHKMHELSSGFTHWGKSRGIAECPRGGMHQPGPTPNVVGYFSLTCQKCGLVGSCTE